MSGRFHRLGERGALCCCEAWLLEATQVGRGWGRGEGSLASGSVPPLDIVVLADMPASLSLGALVLLSCGSLVSHLSTMFGRKLSIGGDTRLRGVCLDPSGCFLFQEFVAAGAAAAAASSVSAFCRVTREKQRISDL